MTAIYQYRTEAGMTQRDLGEKIGVSKNAISQYESGARKPDIVTLKKIAVALKCSADDLLKPIEI